MKPIVRGIYHILRSLPLRVFIGCLLLMVYTLTLSYKGSLNAVLTVTFFPKPMDTLQEIASQVIQLHLSRYFKSNMFVPKNINYHFRNCPLEVFLIHSKNQLKKVWSQMFKKLPRNILHIMISKLHYIMLQLTKLSWLKVNNF